MPQEALHGAFPASEEDAEQLAPQVVCGHNCVNASVQENSRGLAVTIQTPVPSILVANVFRLEQQLRLAVGCVEQAERAFLMAKVQRDDIQASCVTATRQLPANKGKD